MRKKTVGGVEEGVAVWVGGWGRGYVGVVGRMGAGGRELAVICALEAWQAVIQEYADM